MPQNAPSQEAILSALGVPDGATIQQVRFTSEPAAGHDVVTELPATLGLRAVVVPLTSGSGSREVQVLRVPTAQDAGVEPEDGDALARVRAWVDEPYAEPTALMTTMQGVRIFWSIERIAILATPDRLPRVGAALIEATYYELELRSIEEEVGRRWPELEADMPLAFEFDEASLERRKELQERCRQTLMLSARLARIGPQVHAPHLHPPTLASQIGERMRERLQMPHRHELVAEQVEVFEDVYEQCGQRVSDFSLARTGHTLERVIIILLVAQLVMSGFDILTSLGG